jgi:dienelactone hydrolase
MGTYDFADRVLRSAGFAMSWLITSCAPAPSAAPPAVSATAIAPPASTEVKATTFIDELVHGAWDHPRTPFDSTMSSAMPAERLHTLWESLQTAAGTFQSIEAVRTQSKDMLHVVFVTCKFERLRKIIQVVFDERGRVTGLFQGPIADDIEAKTNSLIASAASGDFRGASRDFGETMKGALPPSKFAETWRRVEREVGPWQSVEGFELKPERGFWSVLATSRFERGRLVVKAVYDAQDRIAGLFLLPPSQPWSAPPYANQAIFEERDVAVGTMPSLPGTLSVPKGAGPFPAVVLVHGSGPNDADESIGAVKVFKDLAWGLASRGVAVLRYVKRSRHAPSGIVTQKEEVLDGAHNAIELLRRDPMIDAHRIFVLGHSQGGGLAPRIARDEPSLAGIIILAGATRSLEDALIEQYQYLAALEPKSPANATNVEAARRFKLAVEDPNLRADQDVALPTGGTLKGAYFLDARGYDPPTVAKALSCRILVLQGERDYQVTMKDFDGWKVALAQKAGAVLRSYPSLNHLFIAGAGTPTPSEYEHPGHIDGVVVGDIADFIGREGPTTTGSKTVDSAHSRMP